MWNRCRSPSSSSALVCKLYAFQQLIRLTHALISSAASAHVLLCCLFMFYIAASSLLEYNIITLHALVCSRSFVIVYLPSIIDLLSASSYVNLAVVLDYSLYLSQHCCPNLEILMRLKLIRSSEQESSHCKQTV